MDLFLEYGNALGQRLCLGKYKFYVGSMCPNKIKDLDSFLEFPASHLLFYIRGFLFYEVSQEIFICVMLLTRLKINLLLGRDLCFPLWVVCSWKNWNIISTCSCWIIGDGTRVNFWNDVWFSLLSSKPKVLFMTNLLN